jgi:hypothetical protein
MVDDAEAVQNRRAIADALSQWRPPGGLPQLLLTVTFAAQIPSVIDDRPVRAALFELVARLCYGRELHCRPEMYLASEGMATRNDESFWLVRLEVVGNDCFNGATPAEARRYAQDRSAEIISLVERYRGPRLVDLEIEHIGAEALEILEEWACDPPG